MNNTSLLRYARIGMMLGMLCGLLPLAAQAQTPSNDDFCNALPLQVDAGCMGMANGSNRNASLQSGEPIPACFAQNPATVWFSFVAPPSGRATITTLTNFTGTNDDTEIALYAFADTNCNNLSALQELACSQDRGFFGPFLSVISNISLTPGQTYYVQVSGRNGTQGDFCLEVNSVNPPPNDDICDAFPLEVGAVCDSINGDNTGANAQAGEPVPACFGNGANSVWYTFTGPPSGFVTISTDFVLGRADANPDTEIGFYLAPNGECSNFDELVLIACSQDEGTAVNFAGYLSLAPAPAGETFYVQVSGWDGAEGTFCLEVHEADPPPPALSPNDSLCNAQPIVVGESCTQPNGDNTGAFFELGEPKPGCFRGAPVRSVWFSFVAPASGLVEIRTDHDVGGTLENTEIALYALEGGDCDSLHKLQLIGCDQDRGWPPLDFNSLLYADSLQGGATYYIQVASRDTTGSFCMEVFEGTRPENDSACLATALPVDGQVRFFDNLFGTVQQGESQIFPPLQEDCGSFEGWCLDTTSLQSVWFTFEAPPSGALLIDLCNQGSGTQIDTRIAVYQADKCDDFGSYRLIGANDDLRDCAFASQLPLYCLEPGETYYLMVDGFITAQGVFGISLHEIPISPITASFVTESPYCPGAAKGFVDLSLSGGVTPFTYQWSNGSTTEDLLEVVPGTYTVIATDRCGEVDTATVELVDEANVLLADAGKDVAICKGEAVQLGGAPTASEGLPFLRDRGYTIDVVSGSFMRHDLNFPQSLLRVAGGFEGSFFAGDFGPGAFYALDSDNFTLVRIDSITGRKIVVGETAIAEGHIWTGLAWNAVHNLFYALSTNSGRAVLYAIEPHSARTLPLAVLDINVPIWLAIDPQGKAYTMDIERDSLYALDLSSGRTTAIGDVGFSANFAQDADFDPVSGLLYLAAINEDSGTPVAELRLADLNTGMTVPLGTFGNGSGQFSAYGISGHVFEGKYRYAWEPADGLSETDVPNPVASPQQSTDYVVTVTDICGQPRRDTVSVFVSELNLDFATTTDDGTGNATATVQVSGGVPPYQYAW
ncbi:MAG: hypothetical protein D6730_13490, partial [Bacteroidetes bacterium]